MEDKHPMQPVVTDDHGVQRFKENRIVRFILDQGGVDLNQIGAMDFPQEDQEQFAQLIGYSLCGFEELSYVSDKEVKRAHGMVAMDSLRDRLLARLNFLETKEMIDSGEMDGELLRHCEEVSPQRRFEGAIDSLKLLTDKQRLAIVGTICHGCGKINEMGRMRCQCWRDE